MDIKPSNPTDNTLSKTETKQFQTLAERKTAFNQSILQANATVSISSGNESLALVYKTALEGINEVLKDQLGDNSLQTAYEAGLDVSPEATADRIVSQSTAFFEAFQQNHLDLKVDEALNEFAELIRGGIEQGFSESKDILASLQVLEGQVSADIDLTYDLVQAGITAFMDGFISDKDEDS